jgi:hypothetical protein
VSDAHIRKRLERARLGHLVDRVLADAWSEVWLTTTPAETLALGQSRIGGAPALPRGTAWPRHRWTRAELASWPERARKELDEAIAAGTVVEEGKRVALALPFVAQLDLAELAKHQPLLPRRGHLWLFADQSTHAGELAGYPHCACACFHAEDAELVTVTPPPVPDELPGLAVAFSAARSLPTASDLDLRDDEWKRYTKAIKPLEQPMPRHACLSRPDYGSIALVPPEGYTTLLRVDSDYDHGINWGDAAWITFAIPDAALAACRFDEVRAFCWIG